MINLSPACKQARSLGTLAAIDADAQPAAILLYPAPRPAAGGAASGAAVAAIPLTKPAGSVDAAGLHLTQSLAGLVTSAGEPAWGRIVTGAGDWVVDGDVGVEFVLDTPGALYPGSLVNLLSADFAEGG